VPAGARFFYLLRNAQKSPQKETGAFLKHLPISYSGYLPDTRHFQKTSPLAPFSGRQKPETRCTNHRPGGASSCVPLGHKFLPGHEADDQKPDLRHPPTSQKTSALLPRPPNKPTTVHICFTTRINSEVSVSAVLGKMSSDPALRAANSTPPPGGPGPLIPLCPHPKKNERLAPSTTKQANHGVYMHICVCDHQTSQPRRIYAYMCVRIFVRFGPVRRINSVFSLPDIEQTARA
jgi:hypothetical protein